MGSARTEHAFAERGPRRPAAGSGDMAVSRSFGVPRIVKIPPVQCAEF